MRGFTQAAAVLAIAFAQAAGAVTPASIEHDYDSAARAQEPAFAGFSAERGAAFFRTRHGSDWSCTSCHTDDPRAAGRHARTQKTIAPLAPAANPDRFTDLATVEKWFRRNCNDVLGRACTTQEKGDVLRYLRSLR